MSVISMRAVPPLVTALCARRAQPESGALRIALLNLMPTKEVTERQWLQLLAQAELQRPMHVELFRLTHWTPRHTSMVHMHRYYRPLAELRDSHQISAYDAVIVTGAPLGQVPYHDVKYWHEVEGFIKHLHAHAVPTLYSCWAAQAALYSLYAIPTLRCPTKLTGVFTQQLSSSSRPNTVSTDTVSTGGINGQLQQSIAQLTAANSTMSLNMSLSMPLSRYALPDPATLQQRFDNLEHSLQAVLCSETGEPTVLVDETHRNLFVLGHPEYDTDTLLLEYLRDRERQPNFPKPLNYDLSQSPKSHSQSAAWQALGAQLIGHWLTLVSLK